MSDIGVKICGLTTKDAIDCCARSGARYVGFTFFEASPRAIAPQDAATLAIEVPVGMAKVGLVVNPSDAFLDNLMATVPLDILQCHGQESPDRIAQIKSRIGLPVMKAVGIANQADLQAARAYEKVADQLLFDAKPDVNDPLPGGNGHAFPWDLLQGEAFEVPWMLAGGLHAGNVADAIAQSGARQVDVSSGVEASRGVKSPTAIAAFCAAAMAQ